MKKTKFMRQLEDKFGEPIEELLRRLYIKQKKSGIEISIELNIKEPTVYKMLQWFGISRRSLSEARIGKKMSENSRKKISKIMKGRKITWGKKISKTLKGRKISKKHRRNMSIGLKKYYKTHEPWNKGKKLAPLSKQHRKKISEALQGRKLPEEAIKELSRRNKGKHFSLATEFKKGHAVPKEWREAWSKICPLKKEGLQKLYWDKKLTIPQIAKLFNVCSPTIRKWMKKLGVARRTQSEISRQHWKNPEYQKRVFKGIKRRPSKGELALIRLIEQNKLRFKYCGDGRTFIAGRCPDFIIYGKKKLIEFFGDYWHKPEEEQKRSDFFAKYGFKTLVIWEHELDNEVKVVEKIRDFIHYPLKAKEVLNAL